MQQHVPAYPQESYTDSEIRKLIRSLFDAKTSATKLQKNAILLAQTRRQEALEALEEFSRSSRGRKTPWADWVLDECIRRMLIPGSADEERDYIRVELWQRYEEELAELEMRIDMAETRIVQLQVEKTFLQDVVDGAPEGTVQQAIEERLATMDTEIVSEMNMIDEYRQKMACLEYLSDEIEQAIESPIYRKYGKEYIGMDHLFDDEGEEQEDDMFEL